MQKINELFMKAKTWFNKNYEIPDELGKWDYAMMGMAAGATIINVGSFTLALLAGLFVIHMSWKRDSE
ncbi:hypothetical protein [Kosakonia phage Kc304]|nr:hypothetical protein [Kosakonia phage Kc304]